MKLEYTYFSEIGTRENNEDCLRVVTLPEYDRTLFIVCDGMGGHSYGEIASEAVCKYISAYWEKNPKQNDSEQKVHDATIQAYSMLKNQSLGYEMGTTMVLASLENDRAMVTHCGDSRCYIVDIKGHVKYRTIDHVDDVGYPIEFCDYDRIRQDFGEDGITAYAMPHGIAEVSDDTQMTLYTACGLLNGYASSVTIKSSEELSRHYVWEAYEEWHALQISSKPVVVNPVCDISRLKAMQDWRAPGMTCMYALREKKLFII